MAKENAISAAIGIPHPLDVSGFLLRNMNMATGINIPPIAAKKGNAAFLTESNSPISNSLLS